MQFIHIEGFQLEVTSSSCRNGDMLVFYVSGRRDVNGRLHLNALLTA